MIVTVQKRDIEHLLGCLERLEPLSPPPGAGGWNSSNIGAVAGVCLFELLYRLLETGREFGLTGATLERNEHVLNVTRRRLLAVLQFLSLLAADVADGSYSEEYEDVVEFEAKIEGDERVVVKPRAGFKKPRDGTMFYEV